jgi:hypothetical protein
VIALVAGIVVLIAGYGIWHFGKRIEHDKDARAAYSGELKAKEPQTKPVALVLLSGPEKKWPALEIGDSGSIFLFAGPEGEPLFRFGGDVKLVILSEDGRIKVSVLIQDQTGAVVAELIRNEWKVNPSNSWDRNYNADSLEVRGPTGEVVLQVCALPDRIQMQAKLWASGRQIAFLNGPGPKGGGGIMMFGDPSRPVKDVIAPRFKYPSNLHLGELFDPKS